MQGFSGMIELYFADEFGLCKEDANKKSMSFSLTNDATFITYKWKILKRYIVRMRVLSYSLPWWDVTPLLQVDNAYWLWTFQGRLLQKNNKDRFCQLLWRPRPATLLSEDQIKVACSTQSCWTWVWCVCVCTYIYKPEIIFLFLRMRLELLEL